MKIIHSIFPKNNTGFLVEDELYASTDISKHLEEFLEEYLNGLQCKSAYWTRLEKLVKSSKSPMARMYFCIKVMWNHHMTSPNFGGIFRSIYQMVVVQKGSKCKRKHFIRAKLWENKSCNIWIHWIINCFIIERNQVQQYLWRFFPQRYKSKITKGKTWQLEKFYFLATF